jgi:hypothetical protein
MYVCGHNRILLLVGALEFMSDKLRVYVVCLFSLKYVIITPITFRLNVS